MRREVRELRPGDVEYVAAHMREADVEECWAFLNWSPLKSLRESVAASSKVWVGAVDDRPTVIVGVGSVSLATGKGSPWLLATDELDEPRHRVRFLKSAKAIVAEMLEMYPVLENATMDRHLQSKKLLKWLGFTFGPRAQAGVENEWWRPFKLEKNNVPSNNRRAGLSGRNDNVRVRAGSGGQLSGPGRGDERADSRAASAGRDRPGGGRGAETANENSAASRHSNGGAGG